MRFPRPLLLAAPSCVAVLALSGCGTDPIPGAAAAGAAVATGREEATAVQGDPDTWPLTGLPVADGATSSVRKRPVLVLKMDNSPSSAPQLGLSAADLVVEELVEGGSTRLAAFYYSQIPGDVGPVRSMRASDIGIVSPADAAMVTSGAAPVTIARLREADIDFYGEGTAGFFRDGSRRAPYDLFTDLSAVADETKQAARRPQDYLPWGTSDDLPAGEPAGSIDARFSGGHTTSWTYRDDGYVNDNSFASAGDEFPADTVLVLRVEVGDAGYRDPAGNPVPETKLEGEGEAMLFHGGEVVRGTWSKAALDAPLELATSAGALLVPAGRTWIELVPAEGGEVTVRR